MDNGTTEMVVQRETGLSARDEAKMVDSLVTRGDWSGIGPAERARVYVAICRQHGLNPTSQPFAFLRLNGKEVLYANRGATDQLAAIHRVNRKIIDGPKVVDIAGTKVAYCVAEASLPNGRTETSTATLPVIDPVNLYMKLETKAKRRVTLSILGLGVLDETELSNIPAGAQEPGGGVDLARANDPADATVDEPTGEVAHPLDAFHAAVAAIELPGEAVAVWQKHRADIAALESAGQDAAWRAICERVEVTGKIKSGKVWLKKALAEAFAAAQVTAQPVAESSAREPGDEGPDDEPTPPAGGEGRTRRSNTAANGSAVAAAPASGPVGLVEPWMESESAMRGYLSQRAVWNALENAVRKHSRAIPPALRAEWARLAAGRLQALAIGEGQEIPLDGDHGCRAIVAKWAAEGPVGRASGQQPKAA